MRKLTIRRLSGRVFEVGVAGAKVRVTADRKPKALEVGKAAWRKKYGRTP